MVGMTMRDQDRAQLRHLLANRCDMRVDVRARVDDRGLAEEIRARAVEGERAGIRSGDVANDHGRLDPFDGREPGRYAAGAVESRLNPVRFDGDDIPSSAGIERRSQLFLTDGVRAG